MLKVGWVSCSTSRFQWHNPVSTNYTESWQYNHFISWKGICTTFLSILNDYQESNLKQAGKPKFPALSDSLSMIHILSNWHNVITLTLTLSCHSLILWRKMKTTETYVERQVNSRRPDEESEVLNCHRVVSTCKSIFTFGRKRHSVFNSITLTGPKVSGSGQQAPALTFTT